MGYSCFLGPQTSRKSGKKDVGQTECFAYQQTTDEEDYTDTEDQLASSENSMSDNTMTLWPRICAIF